MLSNYATATRAAAYALLTHERVARDPSRGVRALGFACLGLAFLGTASTVVARQESPARGGTATRKNLGSRDGLVQLPREDLDLSAFVQIAGR
jgi:hypothetical protein